MVGRSSLCGVRWHSVSFLLCVAYPLPQPISRTCLLRSFMGRACSRLHADDRLYQRGCPAQKHGQVALDFAKHRLAGRHRSRVVFSSAATCALAVPLLRYQGRRQYQLLPAMRLPRLSELRHMPRKRACHRPSLHSLRTRFSGRQHACAPHLLSLLSESLSRSIRALSIRALVNTTAALLQSGFDPNAFH